jgi:hypothetical protein
MALVSHPSGDTTQYGYDFVGGEPVEVTDEKHLNKFRGNPFFEVTDGAAEPVNTGLKAEHRGGGRFNITNGESVLAKGLSKVDADAFNSMTEDEKAAYVASLAE